jgi:hypothetical protein
MYNERDWLVLESKSANHLGVKRKGTYTEFGLRMESYLVGIWHHFLIFVSQKRN